MKKTRMQKGITLIALIITIVVLLILAVVVIRAVQGDGILGYAKKSRDDYQKAQDKEKDMLSRYLKSLEISDVNGDEKLVDLYKKGKIKVGDYLNYQPSTAISYKPDGYDIGINTGYQVGELQDIKQEQLKWRFLGYDSVNNKMILISSTPTSETITFYGHTGWNNYDTILNNACNTLYSDPNIGGVSKNIESVEYLANVFLESKGLTVNDLGNMSYEDIKKLEEEFREELGELLGNEKFYLTYKLPGSSPHAGQYSVYTYENMSEKVNSLFTYKLEGKNTSEYDITMGFRPIIELDLDTTFKQVPVLTGEPTPEELKMLDVTDIKVVANADGYGDNLAANTIASGTTLYITFKPTIENAKITKDGEEITLPYPVTENAKHIFEITGTINKKEYTKEVEVIVNQFKYGIKLLQKVNYNELTNGAKNITIATSESGASSTQTLETEDLGWRYMGTKEDGTILLVSKNLVTDSSVALSGKTGYVNGTVLLDRICNKLYGQGTYAERARNMNVQDINKIGNFDPKTADPNKDGNLYIDEYAQMYKYRITKDSEYLETSMSTDGGNTWGEYNTSAGLTEFYDPKRNIRFNKNNPNEEIYINTVYHYRISEYIPFSSIVDNLSFLEKIEILEMQNNFNKASFWLASDFQYCSIDGQVSFGIRNISNNNVTSSWFGNTNGYYVPDEFSYKYCPIIELKRDVKLVKGSNNTWEIVQM